MPTAWIALVEQPALVLLPLVGLLALPLALGVFLYWQHARPAGVWGRVFLALRSGAEGAILTSAAYAPFLLWPGWCRATPQGDLASADSFAVFSFGLGPTEGDQPTPGQTNRALASWLVANNPAKKPVVVQEGVYLALKELEKTQPSVLKDWKVIRIPEHAGVYVDTTGAAFQTDGILSRENLKKPALVSHDYQLWRMARACEDIGLTDVVVPNLPAFPFDPDSVQHLGTRYYQLWLVREVFVARPLTLAPQATLIALTAIAFLYGLAFCRVVRG